MSKPQEQKLGTCLARYNGHNGDIPHLYDKWSCDGWRESAQPSIVVKQSPPFVLTDDCDEAAAPAIEPLTAEHVRQKIYDFWKEAKSKFGQAGWQALVLEEIQYFETVLEAKALNEAHQVRQEADARGFEVSAELERARAEIARLTAELDALKEKLDAKENTD